MSLGQAIPLSHKGQEGVLRVMRSTAYLQRAYTHFMQFRVRDDVQQALVHSHDKVAILLRGIDIVNAIVSSSVYQELVQQISQPLPDMAVFRLLQTIQGTAPFLVSGGEICRVT